MKLLNQQKGVLEEIPDDQLQPALSSGNYAIKKGETHTLIGADNQEKDVSSENLLEHLQLGSRIKSQSEKDDQAQEEKYGSRPIEAGLLGVGRGFSMGLSDWILRETGQYSGEDLSQLKQRNEGASTIGEIGGALIPVGGPASLVGKIGRGVEGLASKALVNEGSSLARQVLAKAGSKALGSAVEGAFWGGGHVISEAALGDRDLNAEHVAASIGLSALGGAAIGGTIGAAGSVLSKAKEKFLDALPEPQLSQDQFQSLGKRMAARVQMFSKIGTEEGHSFRSAILDQDSTLTKDLDKVVSQNFKNNEMAMGRLKDAYQEITPKFDLEEAKKVAVDALKNSNISGKAFESVESPLQLQMALSTTIEHLESVPEQGQLFGRQTLNALKELQESPELWGDNVVLGNQMVDAYKRLALAQRSIPKDVASPEGMKDIISYIKTSQNLIDNAADAVGDVSAKTKIDMKALGSIGTKAEDQVKDQMRNNQYREFLGSLKDKEASFGGGVATGLLADKVIDKGLKGIVGAGGIYQAAKEIQNPKRLLSVLSTIEGIALKHNVRMDEAIEGLINKTKKISDIAPRVGSIGTLALLSEPKDAETKEESFTRVSEDLSRIQNDPSVLQDSFKKNFNFLQAYAPDTLGQLMIQQQKAYSFLYQELPKNPTVDPLNPNAKYIPSSAELLRFEGKMRVVNDPVGTLGKMVKSGIDPSELKAIREIYPNIVSQFAEKLMSKASDPSIKLSFQQKLKLRQFLDLPTPKYQNAFSKEEKKQAPQMRPTSLNIGFSSMTETQKILNPGK